MIRFRLCLTLFALGFPLLAGCCCGPHPWACKPCCPTRPCGCDSAAASPCAGGPIYTSVPTTGSAYSPILGSAYPSTFGSAYPAPFEAKAGCSSCGVPGLPTSNGFSMGTLGTTMPTMPIVPGSPRGGMIYPPIMTGPDNILPSPLSTEPPPAGVIPQLSPVPRLTPMPGGVAPAQPTPADPVFRHRG